MNVRSHTCVISNLKKEYSVVILFAGFSPLLNAQVMATIERPGNAAPIDLDVFDNGAGKLKIQE